MSCHKIINLSPRIPQVSFFQIPLSSYLIRHSSFVVRRSSFIIRHYPLPIRAGQTREQVAFAYTAVVRDLEHERRQRTLGGDDVRDFGDTHGGGRVRPSWVTVRRLRVSTVKAEVCSQAGVVAFGADAAAMATVLTHKVVAEARRRWRCLQRLQRVYSFIDVIDMT